jgi:hypothetical protein
MAINYTTSGDGCLQSQCEDKFGCGQGTPVFTIRQHDTRPEFKVSIEDCGLPMDIRGLVIEVNMWASAKLRRHITATDEYFQLADDIGFEQVMINDIIVMNRVRLPEYMLVTGFDEDDRLVRVQRGYKGTTPSRWKRGAKLRIFRVLNGQGETELVYEDIREIDGTLNKNTITASYLIYKWQPEDTCLPGCYWFEFKMLKMIDLVLFLPGGHWIGPVYHHDDDYYYTGTAKTESSVQLSYDSLNDRYIIPTSQWKGDYHVFSANYYTGTLHNDGSLYLNRNDKPFDVDNAQQPVGISRSDYTVPSRIDDQPLPQGRPQYPSPFGGIPYEPATDAFGNPIYSYPYYEGGPYVDPFLARPYDERVPDFEKIPYENPFNQPFYFPGAIYGDLNTAEGYNDERRDEDGIESDDGIQGGGEIVQSLQLPGEEIVQSLQYNVYSNVTSFVPDHHHGDFGYGSSFVPSFTPVIAFNPPSTFDPSVYGCWLGVDVEWTRRIPSNHVGFLVRIIESPTAEL